jgi:hypothetical protein
MTHDIIVVEDNYQSSFVNRVFSEVKKYENLGHDVEVQYAPRDDRYSAMIIVYNVE